ncbi:MAG: hypothetical protein WAV91_13155, partial [Aquabacterium sp.]
LFNTIQQPAATEPVQADSSEHLRVIASLGAALRRLSFAAQTTGGTYGPDAELQSAIGQAEQALSLGGIWQAMSATPEPSKDEAKRLIDTLRTDASGGRAATVHELDAAADLIEASLFATGEPVKATPYNPTEEMRWAMKRIDPALSSEQCRALWSAAWSVAPSTHPAPSVPATGEPVAQWQKRHPVRTGGRWISTDEHDAKWWSERATGWEARALYTHPAPSVPDDVVRDAERYRFIRDADVSDDLIPDIALYAMESLDEYIDAAMLAAK